MNKFLKLIAAFFLCLFFLRSSFAQDSSGGIKNWQVEAKKVSERKYELSFMASSLNGWLVYAPNQTLLDVKTTQLKFNDSSIQQQDDFILGNGIKTITSPIFENTKVDVYENNATWKAIISINGTVPANLQGTMLYTYGKNDEFYPSSSFSFSVALEGGVESTTRILIPSVDIKHPVNDCGDAGTKGKSVFTIFILGLLGGFIALLTPCVFPMIPLTVSFFTKKTGNKKKGVGNASLYGFFIFFIYVLLTIPFHIAGKTNPEIFNNISTNVWLNLLFFIVFVFFCFVLFRII